MDIIIRHRKLVEDMNLSENNKTRIQNNLDQMEQEWKKIEIYQQEWEKVKQHNQKIQDQIDLLEEEQDIYKLSTFLMTPSLEATHGIEDGQKKIKQLVKQNMDIVRGNNQVKTGLSNNVIFLTIINILIWGIVLYLLFFGPSLTKF